MKWGIYRGEKKKNRVQFVAKPLIKKLGNKTEKGRVY